MTQTFEVFAKEGLIGEKNMKQVLKFIGANFTSGIMSIFKEGRYVG
jgi:Ca2+-binding EF-hand superfamily protein